MINPFNANNDRNYLFRKNYEVITKPSQTISPVTQKRNDFLQKQNPFKKEIYTPMQHQYNPPIQQINRPKSYSKAHSLHTSEVQMSRAIITGKPRLLQQANGWKKQIQIKQRQKLQYYGAEGLRYNSYSPSPYVSNHSTHNLQQSNKMFNSGVAINAFPSFQNQYYAVNNNIKVNGADEKNNKNTKHKTSFGSNDSFNLYKTKVTPIATQANRNNLFLQSDKKQNKQKQVFQDDMQDKIREVEGLKYLQSQQERHSKLNDMFNSDFNQKFRTIQNHSYASYYDDDRIFDSKHDQKASINKNIKKGPLSINQFSSMQSSAYPAENIYPNSYPNELFILGKVYHQIGL